jgi:signal transduction histidine kinase
MSRSDAQWQLPPMARLLAAIMIFAASAVAALWLATSQPWLGLVMQAGDDGLVVVVDVQRQDLPAGLKPGSRITRIGAVDIRAVDVIEEPDTLNSYALLNDFRKRQAELAANLEQPQVTVGWSDEGLAIKEVAVAPQAGRPAWSLPFEFWLQVFVGGAGAIVGGWIWALKRDRPSVFLAISGLGLMVSALSASVYSTRELALDAELFRLLNAGNLIGTNIFGLALISLLLSYPRRIGGAVAIVAVWVIGIGAVVGHLMQLMPSQSIGSYGPMLAQFCVLLALVAVQFIASRRAPLARAALGWFGLSILLGTSVFVFTIAMPAMLGVEPQTRQAHAFGIILIIYCGIAIAVARYRLFDLGIWSFRLTSYLLGGMLLIALDAWLIYGIAVERIPAFGLALLAVALLYLPLRNLLGQMLTRRTSVDPLRVREVVDIALAPNAALRQEKWRALLDNAFAPLNIEPAASTERVQLMDGGQKMLVPFTSGTPAMSLHYAHGGRKLFSQSDADRVQQLVELMDHALASRDAQEQGARQERTRMARDLHDNIGAQLLRTLHSQDEGRKNAIISETLTDLRDIINNAQGTGLVLSEILADLRFETDERLNAVDMDLRWHSEFDEGRVVEARLAHTLRSIVREATSNAIRHANATTFTVAAEERAGELYIHLSDDGVWATETPRKNDGGLVNMVARAEGHGGSLTISAEQGTQIDVRLPLETSSK